MPIQVSVKLGFLKWKYQRNGNDILYESWKDPIEKIKSMKSSKGALLLHGQWVTLAADARQLACSHILCLGRSVSFPCLVLCVTNHKSKFENETGGLVWITLRVETPGDPSDGWGHTFMVFTFTSSTRYYSKYWRTVLSRFHQEEGKITILKHTRALCSQQALPLSEAVISILE